MRLVLLLAVLLTGCGTLQEATRKGGGKATPFGSVGTTMSRLPCAPRKEFVELLGTTLAQAPVAHGLAEPGGLLSQASVLEVLSSPDGQSWTALLTAPNGISCALAGGEAWQQSLDPRVDF